MCFDMRPCLIMDRMELTMLTMLAGRTSGETFVKQQAWLLVEIDQTRRAPAGSKLQQAVKAEKKHQLSVKVIATMILLSMPTTSAIVYYLTNSGVIATIGFFSPIVLYKLWGVWLIFDTQRLLRDSKRKFPDV